MKHQPFSWLARLRSFRYAIQGLKSFLGSEHNAWIHLAATILACLAGWYFRLSKLEWIALLFCFCLVWIAEIANTCIEKIMDHVTPEQHPRVKQIKDMAAGMVLIAAVVALITGCLIFLPRLLL
ncbi:diacylglycerol kinase family protein [Filimonas effusa]|uniref:Diacylglycerol kinase family protein n=1 Tax=Filimonas effusa TaxID=2508721 RepID=A0A4Q1DBE4_9BACT|nr:diacylglycerol kinase family protein [Filimonas effusa]RXK85829.1 diacylglycerol kinase family protein [Filimonas effusa]